MARKTRTLEQDSPSEKADVRRNAKPRCAWVIVVALLTVHSGLLACNGYFHSPTLNEPAHLAAGLSHWRVGRFELYRESAARANDRCSASDGRGHQNWLERFLRRARRPTGLFDRRRPDRGERSFDLFTIARWACILFSWIGGIVCFLWAHDLYEPG